MLFVNVACVVFTIVDVAPANNGSTDSSMTYEVAPSTAFQVTSNAVPDVVVVGAVTPCGAAGVAQKVPSVVKDQVGPAVAPLAFTASTYQKYVVPGAVCTSACVPPMFAAKPGTADVPKYKRYCVASVAAFHRNVTGRVTFVAPFAGETFAGAAGGCGHVTLIAPFTPLRVTSFTSTFEIASGIVPLTDDATLNVSIATVPAPVTGVPDAIAMRNCPPTAFDEIAKGHVTVPSARFVIWTDVSMATRNSSESKPETLSIDNGTLTLCPHCPLIVPTET